jgi:hypothetical protein
MGTLRYIIGFVAALLLSVLGVLAMPMASTAAHQAEFFPHQEAIVAEPTNVHFTARAPPFAKTNVAVTGASVAEQGNGIIMLGHGTQVASLGFGVGFDATNRIPTPDRRVEITELFDSSNPRSGIQIGDRTVLVDPTNRGGARVFDGVSDAEVRNYFTELTGQPLPAPRTITIGNNSNVQLYTVRTPEGSFNLRSGSTSGVGRWTIDVPRGATCTGNSGELKFR